MKKGFIVTAIIAVIVLAAPLSAQQIEYVGSTLWSGVNDMKVRGDFAYCAFNNGLVIFNISGDSTLFKVSELYLGGGSHGIDIDANFAYVADGRSGLQIINITNPQRPIIVGRYSTTGSFQRIQVSNHIAYIGDSMYGLLAIDVSEPNCPVFIDSLNFNNYSIHEIYISNNRAYLLLYHRNSPLTILKIIDITQPQYMIESGEYRSANYSYLNDIVVEENIAYIATSYEGLLVLNTLNPSHISVVGSYNTHGSSSIFLEGNLIFITASSDYVLQIIDISQPASPSLVGSYLIGAGLYNLNVSGNYAYLTNGYFSNIVKVNVLDPASPTRCATYIGTSNTFNLGISGTYAYIASATGLIIVDVSEPSHPLDLYKEQTCLTIGNNIEVFGQLAYLNDASLGFRVFDVANPANPHWLGGRNELGGIGGNFVDNNHAFIAGSSSLQIINVSDARNPELAGSYITPGASSNVYVRGNYAYLTYNYGLNIINISNRVNPLSIGNLPLPGIPLSVFILGDYAYIADDYLGLQIANISDPTNPFLVGSYNTPGYAKDVCVVGNYAFIADYYSIQIVDVANPIDPAYVTHYFTPGWAQGIIVADNFIYVADEYSFLILRFTTSAFVDTELSPASFSLSPAYPNPFNSSTTIRYNLPTESPVTIDIYDILGRKVQTLLDIKAHAGPHQVNWQADGLPSGAYFARLKAGEQAQTTKMILMK